MRRSKGGRLTAAVFPSVDRSSIRRCDASFADLTTLRDLPRCLPALLVHARRLYRLHRLDHLDVADQFAHAAERRLRRAAAVRALFDNERWISLGPQHRDLRRAVRFARASDRLPAGGCDRSAGAGRGHVPLDLPLSLLDVVRRHRPRLAVAAQPELRHPEGGARARASTASLSTGSYGRTRRSTPGHRRASGRLRAGDGDHAGRPARHRRGDLEGGAGRRHPDLARLSSRSSCR